jgi:hypothetical protein
MTSSVSKIFRPDLFLGFAPVRARALGSGFGSDSGSWLMALALARTLGFGSGWLVTGTVPLLTVPPLFVFLMAIAVLR